MNLKIAYLEGGGEEVVNIETEDVVLMEDAAVPNFNLNEST